MEEVYAVAERYIALTCLLSFFLRYGDGNWDTFLGLALRRHECIYPAVSRVAHLGGEGYTVMQDRQVMMYRPMRLAAAPPSPLSAALLAQLTIADYDRSISAFIEQAQIVTCARAVEAHRGQRLVFMLQPGEDARSPWHALMDDAWGITGSHIQGRSQDISKHRGTGLINFLTNTILLVDPSSAYCPFVERRKAAIAATAATAATAAASPGAGTGTDSASTRRRFSAAVAKASCKRSTQPVAFEYKGCFQDNFSQRDLPDLLAMKVQSVAQCAALCARQGHRYAGVQVGWECWCGASVGRHTPDGRGTGCIEKCRSGEKCGGAFFNSVYEIVDPPAAASVVPSSGGDSGGGGGSGMGAAMVAAVAERVASGLAVDDGEVAISGLVGESCTEACRRYTTLSSPGGTGKHEGRAGFRDHNNTPQRRPHRCSDQLLSLLQRDCTRLKRLLGCTACTRPNDPQWKNAQGKWIALDKLAFLWQTAAPGRLAKSKECFISSAKFLSCDVVAPPTSEFRRACVCTRAER